MKQDTNKTIKRNYIKLNINIPTTLNIFPRVGRYRISNMIFFITVRYCIILK